MVTDVIHEKGTGVLNEDAFTVTDNLFGVFDGATSLTRQTFEDQKTGGFFASQIARDIFHQNHGSLSCLARKANNAILAKMLENGVDVSDRSALWSTSCAVVRVEHDRIEWVQTGDSLILIVHEDGTYEIPVKNYDHDRETLLMWKKLAGSSGKKKIHEILKDQIRKVRSEMNVTYGVLNGESGFARFLNTGSVPKKNVKHVLLFTDGLFLPSSHPDQEPDFGMFVSIFLAGGLKALRDHVRGLECSDPDCRHFPRFKTHDDIAAISISFTP